MSNKSIKFLSGLMVLFFCGVFATANVSWAQAAKKGNLPSYQDVHQKAFSGKRAEARAMAKKILAKKPNAHDVRILLGRLYAWNKSYNQARKEFRYVLRVRPESTEARSALIDVEMWTRNYKRALALVDQGLSLKPNSQHFKYKKALIYFRAGDLIKAEIAVNDYLAGDASNTKGLKLKKKIADKQKRQAKKNKNKKGLYNFNTAVAQERGPQNPDNPELKKRLETDPGNDNSAKKAKKAIKTAKRRRSNGSSPYNRIRAEGLKGDRAKARAMAERRLATNPRDHDTRILLGRLYAWDKDHDTARTHLEKVVADKPRYADARDALIDVEMWDGNYERAIELADEGLRYERTNRRLLYKKALAYYRWGKTSKAVRSVNSLLDIHPGDADGTALVARLRKTSKSAAKGFTKLGIDSDWSNVSNLDDHWRNTSVSVTRRTPLGSLIGRINTGNRFDKTGHQYEVDFYPKIMDGMYVYLSYGYSAFSIYSQHRYAYEPYFNVPGGWEFSIGQRFLQFRNSSVRLYTGTIAKYLGNYWFSFRPYVSEKESGYSKSFNLTARKYYSSEDHYISVSAGIGDGPDNPDDPTDPTDVDITRKRSIGADGKFPITDRLFVAAKVGYKREYFDNGRYREITTVGAGVECYLG